MLLPPVQSDLAGTAYRVFDVVNISAGILQDVVRISVDILQCAQANRNTVYKQENAIIPKHFVGGYC